MTRTDHVEFAKDVWKCTECYETSERSNTEAAVNKVAEKNMEETDD